LVSAILVLALGATAVDAWTRSAGGPVQAVVLALQPEVLRALAGERDVRISGTWLGGHVIGLQAASVAELHGVPGWIVRMPAGASVAVPGCL
jgi:hypothetical protein